MPFTDKLIKHADQITTEWTGGTTTQLAIYPPESSYASRAFTWRLSSATVTLPESKFTSLPGFRRILMILSGEIRLVHEHHHEKQLPPFAQDSFDGSWNTTSHGRAVDFNLMMAEGVDGQVEALTLSPGETKAISLAFDPDRRGPRKSTAFYAFSGAAEIRVRDKTYPLAEKDILLLHEQADIPRTATLSCPADTGDSHLIHSTIYY